MKNLIMQFWDFMLSHNLERLSAPHRSYGDIEAYTMLEIVLLATLFVATAMMIYYWVSDLRKAAKRRRQRREERLAKMAEEELAAAQRRLEAELEFTFAPAKENISTAGEPEDFFEVFYRVCPEFAPKTPR